MKMRMAGKKLIVEDGVLVAKAENELHLQRQWSSIICTPRSLRQKLLLITKTIQPFIPFDYIEIEQRNVTGQHYYWVSFLRVGFNEYQTISESELSTITTLSVTEVSAMRSQLLNEAQININNGGRFLTILDQFPRKRLYAKFFGLNANATLPLASGTGSRFVVTFYSKAVHAYDHGSIQFLSRIQKALAGVFEKLMEPVKGPVSTEAGGPATQCKIRQHASVKVFDGIVGKSHSLLAALDFVEKVSPLDTSVLILGETGTGKEIIAERIHYLSGRIQGPLVKINCAAIPAGLVESELFGHEKGAFTGASARRIGKFEQADGGTIFLDEIGDMPPDIQVKLLRVLQEREIERIGGRDTVKLDVRIVTATNKNLETEVAEGRFRMDLYYRLNVFPVWIPPLRKRKEDIPLLVSHFINLYAEKHNLAVSGITPDALEQLIRYDWPGNIRELENSIERSVIMTGEGMIGKVFIKPAHLEQLEQYVQAKIKTIEEVEKDHIQIVLARCNNKVYGAGGAAEMLKIPPTTLMSKIKKLGVVR
jgi:transcriptional regulator with GAF, ATPase, and Fis domain